MTLVIDKRQIEVDGDNRTQRSAFLIPHSPVGALIGCSLALILLDLMINVPGRNATQRQPAELHHKRSLNKIYIRD